MPSSSRTVGDLTRAVAQELREVRVSKQMTQRYLAVRAGIPANTYNTIENGKSAIDLEQLSRLAGALRTSSYQLLLDAERRGTGGRNQAKLSAREIQVLREILLTDSKIEASESLFISLGTLNTHLVRIRHKFQQVGRRVPTKAALLREALVEGIVELDEL